MTRPRHPLVGPVPPAPPASPDLRSSALRGALSSSDLRGAHRSSDLRGALRSSDLRGARRPGPGSRGRRTAGPCDAGPPRARARRPICPDLPATFTNPAAPARTHEGAAPREPWVLPLLPVSIGPTLPEPPPSAPRSSPRDSSLASQHLPIHATLPGLATDPSPPGSSPPTPPTRGPTTRSAHAPSSAPPTRGARSTARATTTAPPIRGARSPAHATTTAPPIRGARSPAHAPSSAPPTSGAQPLSARGARGRRAREQREDPGLARSRPLVRPLPAHSLGESVATTATDGAASTCSGRTRVAGPHRRRPPLPGPCRLAPRDPLEPSAPRPPLTQPPRDPLTQPPRPPTKQA